MTNTDLRILVQKENQLNPEKVADTINKTKDAKLIIIHSSITDDKKLENYIKNLNKKIKTPMIGLKVSGTYTQGNYYENVIVTGVLCGDMEVEVHHEKINYENLEKTAKDIKGNLKQADALLVYAGTYIKNGGLVDVVLRQIHSYYPSLQSWGGFSTPEPKVFTNEGFFTERIAYAVIRGIEYEFSMESGFELKPGEEHTITKVDNHQIYEIDNKNAVETYCGLTKARPWFINMYMKQVAKPSLAKVMGLMAKANEGLYKAVTKATLNLLGRKTKTGRVEILPPLYLDEDKGMFITHSYTPNGTRLRWISFTEKTMLDDYSKIKQKTKNTKASIGHTCSYSPITCNFKYEEAKKRLKQKQPYMISYTFGEIANTPPFDKKQDNITHTGTINVVGIR